MNQPEIVVKPECQMYNTTRTSLEEALQKLEDSMVEYYRAMAALVMPILRKRTAWKEETP